MEGLAFRNPPTRWSLGHPHHSSNRVKHLHLLENGGSIIGNCHITLLTLDLVKSIQLVSFPDNLSFSYMAWELITS